MEPQQGARNAQELLVGGAFLALFVILALGAGLLLASRYGDFVERCARARRTAAMLLGAGAVLVSLVLVALVAQVHAVFSVFVVGGLVALFVLGFTADALRTGRRLTGRDGPA